jgi:hypothetical protein
MRQGISIDGLIERAATNPRLYAVVTRAMAALGAETVEQLRDRLTLAVDRGSMRPIPVAFAGVDPRTFLCRRYELRGELFLSVRDADRDARHCVHVVAADPRQHRNVIEDMVPFDWVVIALDVGDQPASIATLQLEVSHPNSLPKFDGDTFGVIRGTLAWISATLATDDTLGVGTREGVDIWVNGEPERVTLTLTRTSRTDDQYREWDADLIIVRERAATVRATVSTSGTRQAWGVDDYSVDPPPLGAPWARDTGFASAGTMGTNRSARRPSRDCLSRRLIGVLASAGDRQRVERGDGGADRQGEVGGDDSKRRCQRIRDQPDDAAGEDLAPAL